MCFNSLTLYAKFFPRTKNWIKKKKSFTNRFRVKIENEKGGCKKGRFPLSLGDLEECVFSEMVVEVNNAPPSGWLLVLLHSSWTGWAPLVTRHWKLTVSPRFTAAAFGRTDATGLWPHTDVNTQHTCLSQTHIHMFQPMTECFLLSVRSGVFNLSQATDHQTWSSSRRTPYLKGCYMFSSII